MISKITKPFKLLIISSLLLTYLYNPSTTRAQEPQRFTCEWDSGGANPSYISFTATDAVLGGGNLIDITFTAHNNVADSQDFYLRFQGITTGVAERAETFTGADVISRKTVHQDVDHSETQFTSAVSLHSVGGDEKIADCGIYRLTKVSCTIKVDPPSRKGQANTQDFTFTANGLPSTTGLYQKWMFTAIHRDTGEYSQIGNAFNNNGTDRTTTFAVPGIYDIQLVFRGSAYFGEDAVMCTEVINVCQDINDCNDPPEAVQPNPEPYEVPPFEICANIIPDGQDDEYQACDECFNAGGIWTAVGCINTDPAELAADLFTLGVSVAGGIALLMILYGAFLIVVSTGNPENIQKGKEIVTGAIAGLLFIIFSVVILNIIGVQILQIPGL